VSADPRLNWGKLGAFPPDRAEPEPWEPQPGEPQPGEPVPRDLARMWQLAGESLGLVARPIGRFELAGTLNEHPGHVRSDQAKRNFPAIFALAVTGRSAPEPLRSRSRAVAARGLLAWAAVYRPTGNPIDEWFFVPLLQAVDLVAGTLAPAGQTALRDWAGQFVTSGESFYAPRAARNPSRGNNWMARHLLIVAVAATVAGDTAARGRIPDRLTAFAARNYVAGPDGRRDGRTTDFVQRDALHYHIAAVQPLVEVLMYAPGLVGPDVRAAVLSGLEFVRPFFLGEREHIEFAHTANAFDRERRDAGNPVFRLAPWDPDHGRVLLRLARAVFPEIRGWTEPIVDHRYDPRTKLLTAIHGEPQRQAEWP
jgi:Alginate lyase